ncbi:JAB domain-containing protein [Limosilactobacillus gastricus]|uniref:JAB domain-containing protein n=1 Tax=Limosilactobacillus gastricus TaxID=227942 RepID=UPI0026F1B5F1|nr:JAB domain-containing protein [Limosilactobacillus gastricus]
MRTYLSTNNFEELVQMMLPDRRLAQRFIATFGSFQELHHAQREQMQSLIDYDPVNFRPVIAAIQIGQQALTRPQPMTGQLNSSYELGQQLIHELAGEDQEQVMIIGVDVHSVVIDRQVLFKGGSHECQIYMDQVFRYLIQIGAHGLIFAHNHPSGLVEPSPEDRQFFKQLQASCRLMNIRLVDCMIVGRNDYFSWQEKLA